MMRIEIFDTTLREGTQTPYVNFGFKDKVNFLKKLFEIGIDFAEVGYPISSKDEMEEIRKLTSFNQRPILSSLGRATLKDVQACNFSNTEIIDIDLGISPYQLEYLKISLEDAYKKALNAVAAAKKTGKRIKFAALDTQRTAISHVIKLYEIVSKAGAEWFTLCDTVGISNPDEVKFTIGKLKTINGCKLSVHFHNDFDMATSNTITAALVGAQQLELTVNGLGDRAGIAPMSPVVTYLKEVKGCAINVDLTKLRYISDYVSEISKIEISPLEPVVGDYCFKHSPGVHVAGILSNPLTFEPINPEKVGQTREIALGRYSGKKAVKSILSKNDINASDKELVYITKLVKNKAKKGEKITETKLLSLLYASRET